MRDVLSIGLSGRRHQPVNVRAPRSSSGGDDSITSQLAGRGLFVPLPCGANCPFISCRFGSVEWHSPSPDRIKLPGATNAGFVVEAHDPARSLCV